MPTLGPLFDKPLHVSSWKRPVRPLKDWDAFRVTGTYDGEDLINGGLHRAVDVGNYSRWGSSGVGEKILAPVDCPARGLYHFDGAKGLDLSIGPDLSLRLFHLHTTLPVDPPKGRTTSAGPWRLVTKGQWIGVTGNTGLGTGAHTHIELWHRGARIDPEPYLELVESHAIPLPEDDMQIKGEFVRHIHNRSARVTVDSSFRTGPSTSDARIDVLGQGSLLFPICEVKGESVGTAPDKDRWYYGIKTAGVEGQQMGCVHSSVLPRSADGTSVVLQPVESGFSQADMAAAETKGRASMKREIEAAISGVVA